MVVRFVPNGRDHDRVGISTGRRLGGAVVRNTVRRRIREIVRRCDALLRPPGTPLERSRHPHRRAPGERRRHVRRPPGRARLAAARDPGPRRPTTPREAHRHRPHPPLPGDAVAVLPRVLPLRAVVLGLHRAGDREVRAHPRQRHGRPPHRPLPPLEPRGLRPGPMSRVRSLVAAPSRLAPHRPDGRARDRDHRDQPRRRSGPRPGPDAPRPRRHPSRSRRSRRQRRRLSTPGPTPRSGRQRGRHRRTGSHRAVERRPRRAAAPTAERRPSAPAAQATFALRAATGRRTRARPARRRSRASRPNPQASPTPPPNLCPAQPGADPIALLAWIFTPIFQVLFLGLAFLYSVTSDIGIAIILLTILIRILLVPVFRAQIVSQRRMQLLQPELRAIQLELQGQPREDLRGADEALSRARREPGVRMPAGPAPARPAPADVPGVQPGPVSAPDISSMLTVAGVTVVDIQCQTPGEPDRALHQPRHPVAGLDPEDRRRRLPLPGLPGWPAGQPARDLLERPAGHLRPVAAGARLGRSSSSSRRG